MKDNKEQLIRDTLAYLKQEKWIPSSKQQPKPSPLLCPTPTLKQATHPAPASKPTRHNRPNLESKSPLLISTIRKHLPHISIVEAIPSMQRVAILLEDEDERPFLEGLKKAIEDRFCSCTILHQEDAEIGIFSCLLTPKDRNHPCQILLAPVSTYQDNREEKRALWTQICQTLSPKSS